MNRRTALKTFGAGLGVCMSGLGATMASAQPRRAANLRWIDVHCHVNAPIFVDFNARVSGQRALGIWNLEGSIRDMDEAGVALAVLSGWTPSEGGTAAERAGVARGTNEYIAQIATDHPGRFALFATLPLPDIEASIKETAYAFDVLGAVGLLLCGKGIEAMALGQLFATLVGAIVTFVIARRVRWYGRALGSSIWRCAPRRCSRSPSRC